MKDVSRMMSGFWVETVLSMLSVVDFVGCLGVAMSGCLLVFFGEVLFFSDSPLLRLRG